MNNSRNEGRSANDHDTEARRPDDALRAVIVSGFHEPTGNIDLQKAGAFLLAHWRTLLAFAFAAAMAMYAASYLFPRIYRGEVLMAPVTKDSEQSGISGALSKFGGLAGAVGLSVDDLDVATERALAIMQSRGFIEQFISDNQLMPILFPRGLFGGPSKRTLQDGYRKFMRDVLLVKRDKTSKLIQVQVDWRDSAVAADWANKLVDRLNSVTRALAIDQSERSLNYLKEEYEKTDSVLLRQSISSVMETQTNNRMMAETRPQYSFEILDSAKTSDLNKYVSPKRWLLALAGSFLGLLVGAFWCSRKGKS